MDAELLKLIEAARKADWQQVVLNGGPPCFHLDRDGTFCLRAQRWDGHRVMHAYTPLHELVARAAGVQAVLVPSVGDRVRWALAAFQRAKQQQHADDTQAMHAALIAAAGVDSSRGGDQP